MTYDEFIKACEELCGVSEPQAVKTRYGYGPPHEQHRIEQEWVSGGITGGNCWGGEPDSPVSPDDAPTTWPALDAILERWWPDISYLQFRKYIQPLFKSDSYSAGGDYYGNYYNYSVNIIYLNELFDILVKQGIIEE